MGPRRIELTEAERRYLEALAGHATGPHRLARRARLVLLAAEGLSDREIGQRVGYAVGTIRVWRRRFARGRLESLAERPRGRRSATLTAPG